MMVLAALTDIHSPEPMQVMSSNPVCADTCIQDDYLFDYVEAHLG